MNRVFAIVLTLCLCIPLLCPLAVGATAPDMEVPPVYTMTEVAANPAPPAAGATVTISTTEELLAFATYVNNGRPTAGIVFRQEATVTLNTGKFNVDGRWFELDGTTLKKGEPTPFTPIGHTEGAPIAFLGTFDGNGYHINGLYINMKAESIGFFALLGPGAVLKDISFRNGFVGGTGTAGMLAGQSVGTAESPVLIDYCKNRSNLSVKEGAAGGIVGSTAHTLIANCSNEGWVTGASRAAGIVALAGAGTEIYTSANLQVARCTGITGGIAAELSPQTVLKNCLNVAHLAGNEQKGAIVGQMADGATVAGCYYKEGTASPGIGGTEADVPAVTTSLSDARLKSTAQIIEMNTFHLTDARIRAICHPWQRGTDHPVIGAAPTAVTVTEDDVTFGAGSLSAAATVCGTDAVVKLIGHTSDPGGEISGTYTLDLNGYTLTLAAPLVLKGGTVTVTDTAETDLPAGKLLAHSSEALRLSGGSLRLVKGNIVSTSTYAIRCEGIGTLWLPTRPQVIGAGEGDLYLRYANVLEGAGP
ncbi:MAG: hypothetical protein E7644_06785, partial [Ruminococcaceae bacterium]|nr:hypothetical protein [Oscillospiraceae bacterium]